MKFIIISLVLMGSVFARTGDLSYEYQVDNQLEWAQDVRNPANDQDQHEHTEQDLEAHSEHIENMELDR